MNIIAYVFAKIFNGSKKQSDTAKNLACCMAMCTVQKYQYRVQDLLKETTKNEIKYRMRLEKDILTKVHSRVYIQEVVNKTFEIKGGDDPIGLVACKSCVPYKTAFNAADEALYESKNNGKNRVTIKEI